MDQKMIDILNRELPLHYKPGPRGMKYPYVDGKDVVATLNAAFAHDWSSEVVDLYKEEGMIVMQVKLTHGGTSHVGFGGGAIAINSSTNKPVDIANAYKSAYTNALKKAATQFGVGLGADEFADDNVGDGPALVADAPKPTGAPTHHRVENSTTVSTKAFTPENMAALSSAVLAEMNKMKAAQQATEAPASSPAAPSPAPIAPVPRPQYNPQKAVVASPDNPFAPSSSGKEKINDIQVNAIKGLLKVRKLTFDAVAPKPGVEIESITKEEAKQIIRALNQIKQS